MIFFKKCVTFLYKIVEATERVNPYDYRTAVATFARTPYDKDATSWQGGLACMVTQQMFKNNDFLKSKNLNSLSRKLIIDLGTQWDIYLWYSGTT